MNTRNPLHPLTLSFRSPALEQALSAASLKQTIAQGRFAIVLGSLVFLLTSILDPWFVPATVAHQVWTIRLTALCMPVFVVALSFTRWFAGLRDPLLASIGMAAGVGVIAMQALLPIENASHFYPAVLLATFFTYNFVGTRFIYALCVDLSLIAGYNLVFGLLLNYPLPVLVSHDFIIVSANLVGGSAGYLAERQRRLLFLRERELEEVSLAKSKFLAAASHDLRQPLNAANLLIEALRRERDPDKAAVLVAHLGASTESLGELLNELLDISKIEAGTLEPQIVALDLEEIFAGLARELGPLADAKGIELAFVARRVAVESDPLMLGRILRNLIANAIRYTETGSVLVGCRRRGKDRIAIAVYDTGPGIAPEHHEAIFREFYQLANPERDRRKGLGLGLAIVDGLCRLLGHRVELRSKVGRGSAFFVEVPVAAAPAELPSGAGEMPCCELTGRAVLVIDDERGSCLAMAEVLQSWGCRTLTAESADEATARLAVEAFQPDVVVADYRLRQGRTGAEAIAAVRRTLGRPVPALIVTGDTAPERLREASASGFVLLHKPVQPSRLRAALADLCREAPAEQGTDTLPIG